MSISLDDIDKVVARTNASYKEAKEALEACDGDVVEAIVYIESKDKTFAQNLGNTSEQIFEKVKESLKKGNVTKIIIRKDGEVIMNIPITAGAIGTVLSPQIALLGFSTALFSKCTFEIVKENGEVVNINEAVEKKMSGSKQSSDTDDDNA